MSIPTAELSVGLLEALAEYVPFGLVVLGTDGRTICANREAESLVGGELIGHSPSAWPERVQLTSLDGAPLVWADLPIQDPTGLADAFELDVLALDASSSAVRKLHVSSRVVALERENEAGVLLTLSPASAAETTSEADRSRADVGIDHDHASSGWMPRVGPGLGGSRLSASDRLAVLVLDIDRFKVINDVYGHAFGDRLLAQLGRRLRRTIRKQDALRVVSGGMFAVLIADVDDRDEAIRAAERLQRAVSQSFEIDDREVYATVSVGIALSGDGEQTRETLFRNAETAMYRAKAAGRSRHQVFDPQAHASDRARMDLEAELHHAVYKGQLVVHYQPIIDLASTRVRGFEALVRWQHPRRGFIPPLEFIPLAEETELIVPIDRLVLTEACKRVVEWNRHRDPDAAVKVNVNFSGRQFEDPGLVEEVERVLESTGADPTCVNIEVTESVVMRDHSAAAAMLERLRELGIGFSIDDFGTGYSSLGSLHVLPFDSLKIDRSFVGGMDGRNKNYEIVRTIVTLAKSLGLTVVAEGVETVEQRAAVSGLGCELAQGHLFSRPVEAAAAERMLRDERSV